MKTIRDTKQDDLTLRLLQMKAGYTGVVFAADGACKARIEGADADDVWRRLQIEAGKANPRYVGFDGARSRFLHFFPNGFASNGYLQQERDYKVRAKTRLDEQVPLERAARETGFGEAALGVFRMTNLFSPFEMMRIQDVLRGNAADPFLQAAARFALGDTTASLGAMQKVLKPHDSAKWTVATYLPFLWLPEAHMFLKPEVTKDFAARVGHRLASIYEARLDVDIYDALLDLVGETETELTDLEPRDRIDVQSFIWVVGYYKEGQHAPRP